MPNTDFERREIWVEDTYVEGMDPLEATAEAREMVEHCASSAGAQVDVEFLREDGCSAVFEVSGHYTDIGPFMRRWDDEYA